MVGPFSEKEKASLKLAELLTLINLVGKLDKDSFDLDEKKIIAH